jgi:hypothetical protein
VLFGLDAGNMGYTLNDYLYGHCSIEEVAHDVTGRHKCRGEVRSRQ